MMKLQHFLRLYPHPGFGATDASIYQSRSRAKRLGLPDPYPFLVKQRGTPGLIVVPEAYNAWAPLNGKQRFNFELGGEGR